MQQVGFRRRVSLIVGTEQTILSSGTYWFCAWSTQQGRAVHSMIGTIACGTISEILNPDLTNLLKVQMTN